ncbi:MAG: sialidase family protein, partial [Planctomycetota bacterium]
MRSHGWLELLFVLCLSISSFASAESPLELPEGETRIGAVGGWPSFVNLNDGTMLAVRGDQWYRSPDGGRTWQGPEERLVDPEQRSGVTSIIRLASGKLGVILLRVAGIPNVGHDEANFRSMWLGFATSDDDGKTWSKPVQMNRYGTHGVPHIATLIQTSTGRLILPVRTFFGPSSKVHAKAGAFGIVDGKRQRVAGHTTYGEIDVTFCYLSDDEGQTWRKSDGFIFGWEGEKGLGLVPCDEPVAIELKDGAIMLLARTTIGQLYKVLSRDGGENWDMPQASGLASAYAPCMIRRIPTTGDLLLIWNQASRNEIERGYERSRLSVAISQDEGETWIHAKTIFRSHLPAVGLLDPGPVTGWVGVKPFVGEIPLDFASADYPNIAFNGDDVLFHYDRNPKFGPKAGAYWTLRIFPIA